ncbi:MAG: heavy metal translocating P-type ATPase [Gammaproteobacteria bacterium]|nr:heavy metal translocating P-type ATPase [Gammaproteobacteria bacterium]
MTNEPSEQAYKDAPYQILVDDMSCQHCVNAVEKAVMSVINVSSASVNLSEGLVKVTGGLPHEVADAIKEAGYPAKPQPKRPENCPITDVSEPDQQAVSESVIEEKIISDSKSSYQIQIADMTCTSCVATVEKAILSVEGVLNAQVNLVEKNAYVTGGDPNTVIDVIIDQGYDASLYKDKVKADQLLIVFKTESDTKGDDDKLKALLNEFDSELEFNWPKVSLKTAMHPALILLQLNDAGYQAEYEEQFEDPHLTQAEEARKEIRRSWQRAILAGGMGVLLMAGDMSGMFPKLTTDSSHSSQIFWGFMAALSLFIMWFSGRSYYRTAIKQAKHLSSNMDTLVALGTSAAWLSSVIIIINPEFIPGGGNHLYLDASVFILSFLQFGHALETRAKRVTSEAIGALVQLTPKSATLLWKNSTDQADAQEREVNLPVSLLRKGDLIRIKPGETIPIDAEVVSGTSNIDESMLTGEPMAVSKQPGDEIIGGTGNRNGSLVAAVIRLGEDTTLSSIVHMVQQAQLSKPPIANLVDKISSVFVPVVIIISIISFFSWSFFGPQPQLSFAFTAGIAVLVIACPCALGLATPIAIMVGTGRAAQLGILIKNSDALQSAANLTHLVMDKTGTLTEGKPVITSTYPASDIDENHLLQLALSLEVGSEHPLAEAVIQNAQEKDIEALECHNFQAITGHGISGVIEQQTYFLGNVKLMSQQGTDPDKKWLEIASKEANMGGTPIWLSSSEALLGLLILKDPIRKESASAIQNLHNLGIKVVMCTGDHHDTASAVGQSLGIDEIHSELLPEQKLEVITKLQEQGFRVGMVGDGVNDAPALAKADTGFAIGSGTDVAIEHADVTLVGDSLNGVSTAVRISTATLSNIKQNLFGAFIYNVIGIPLAAGLFYPLTGWLLNPMFASFAMAMSSVTVVTNANRLRFFKVKH